MWLLALVLFAALAAAAVLFIQYRLENIRQRVQQAITARMGADFVAERVQVNGFRGISIRDFSTRFATPNGPTVDIQAPEAFIYIDLGNLFYGELTVDRFQIDKAQILLERPEESQWLVPKVADLADATGLENLLSFRLMGKDCTVSLRNVVADTALTLHHVNFDVSKLADVPDVVGRVSAALDQEQEKALQGTFHYVSPEDFDARAALQGLSAADLNIFLPASRQLLSAGAGDATVRLTGYPKGVIVLALDTDFSDLVIQNQPAVLSPATGNFSAVAAFDTATRVLSFSSARVQSEQLSGRMEGSITFGEGPPLFDLNLESTKVPLTQALAYLLESQPQQLQGLQVEVAEPYQVSLALRGTSEAPVIGVEADLAGGTLKFQPKQAQLPSVDLELSLMKITWDSASGKPQGIFNIRDGRLHHAPSGLRATRLSGTLRLEEGRIVVEPLLAEAFGAPLTARVEYQPDQQQFSFTTSGMLDLQENNPFTTQMKHLDVKGLLNFRCAGRLVPDHYVLDCWVDATRAEVAYDWWLKKPAGVGATLEAFNVDVRPGKSIQISGTAAVDTANITSTFDIGRNAGKWQLRAIRAKSDRVEVATLNKCLTFPYVATGGAATAASLDWKRAGTAQEDFDAVINGEIDHLSVTPEGAEVPFQFEDAKLGLIFINREAGNSGRANLKVAEAKTPALGQKWFVPLRPPGAEPPPKYRPWEFELAADRLELPPWSGAAFAARAYVTAGENGVHHFRAAVEEGSIEGAYRFQTGQNISHLDTRWTQIPVRYLIEHLKFPAALEGATTGNFQYIVDQDDPNTLKGSGAFAISDGQFSADFIYAMLHNRLQGSIGTLPPSLGFSTMRAEVELQGDTVFTRNIHFESPGIVISGTGQFVLQGDMDYSVNVSVTPEVAEKIPALRDNLNVEGHRLTQSPIQLAFHITGPAFNPRGAVAGLPPVGVTLVSGAFEVTSEAIKVIDIPRQILLDLFKIGGGIVGATQ